MTHTRHETRYAPAFVGLIVAVTVAGCGSARDDVETLCNAESRWEAATKPGPMLDQAQRPRLAFQWANERMKSSRGKKISASIGAMPPPEQGKLLRAEATDVGVTPCPFADFLDKRAAEQN